MIILCSMYLIVFNPHIDGDGDANCEDDIDEDNDEDDEARVMMW